MTTLIPPPLAPSHPPSSCPLRTRFNVELVANGNVHTSLRVSPYRLAKALQGSDPEAALNLAKMERDMDEAERSSQGSGSVSLRMAQLSNEDVTIPLVQTRKDGSASRSPSMVERAAAVVDGMITPVQRVIRSHRQPHLKPLSRIEDWQGLYRQMLRQLGADDPEGRSITPV